jgi:hypothetical protein
MASKVHRSNLIRVVTSSVICAVVIGMAVVASAATRPATESRATTITLELPKAFNPIPPKGSTDLYHCALLNPNVKTDQMITSTTFKPGTPFEVHHAVIYWVPPSQVKSAEKLNDHGKGWTCFGGPGIGGVGTFADLGSASWLSGWGPGHGTDNEPTGTGMPLPTGSMVVMQIHYNLLAGHKPDRSKLSFTMVPAAGSDLLPLKIDLFPTAIDIPCPAGVTGKLCNRAASLADVGKRFGKGAIQFDNLLEEACNGGVPVPSDTTNCVWNINSTAYIWRITPHEHLLGLSMKVTLNPGTADSKVLLNAPYDFHDQRGYDMAAPVEVVPGDKLQVSCTYNPLLRGELPYLKNLPPRYVLWADGSSDEMCLAIASVTSSLTLSSSASAMAQGPGTPQWPAALLDAGAKGHNESATAAMEQAITQDLGDGGGGFESRFGLCGASF